jgi:hypothetical protein
LVMSLLMKERNGLVGSPDQEGACGNLREAVNWELCLLHCDTPGLSLREVVAAAFQSLFSAASLRHAKPVGPGISSWWESP